MSGSAPRQHPPPLDLTFPADWLGRCGLSRRAAEDVLIAVGEACANAIEHGLRHNPGRIRLTAEASATRLRVTVRDTGRWRPGPSGDGYRGHGIALMRAVMHQVDIHLDPAGTTVDMQREIG